MSEMLFFNALLKYQIQILLKISENRSQISLVVYSEVVITVVKRISKQTPSIKRFVVN